MASTEGAAKPRLAIVVGSGSATVREILRYGSAVAELVLIFDAAEEDEAISALRLVLRDEVECLVYRRGDASVLRRHHAAPLQTITTFAEDKIRLTAEIAAQLNVPYHSPACAHALTDKGAQREALARAGLGIGFGVAEDAQQAAELIRKLGGPCVIKPATGSGSRYTYPVDGARSLARLQVLYPAVVEARLETGRHPHSDQLADVVSVESVFCDGRPVHIGVSGRFRLAEPFRETGMVFPSQLPDAMLGVVCDMASRALAALGVTTGATHTELKLTPSGPQVIEVNGRLGGDVGRLVELSTGTHAVELVLRAVCGLPVSAPRPTAVAGVSMLVPPADAKSLASRVPAASLKKVDGVVAVDVHSRAGDAVDYRTGWWAHVACVWYRGCDWPSLSATHTAASAVADAELTWGKDTL